MEHLRDKKGGGGGGSLEDEAANKSRLNII